MTPEEARLHLDACTLRPSDAEPEARALAGQDPALGAWVEKRAASDEKLADAFNASPVPASLNDRLLAAMMAEVKEETEVPAPSPAPVAAPGTKKSALFSWLALAAVVTLSAAGLWWKTTAPAWETEALAIVREVNDGRLALDAQSPDIAPLKALLAAAKAPTPEQLPQDLTALSTLGCKVIQIGGRPASVVCFQITKDKAAHLVTFKVADVSRAPSDKGPKFVQQGEWQVATWSAGDQGYLLATQADARILKDLFAVLMALGQVAWLV